MNTVVTDPACTELLQKLDTLNDAEWRTVRAFLEGISVGKEMNKAGKEQEPDNG